MTLLSIVSPVYNEENCIEELHRRLSDVLLGMGNDCEIILVDDGSTDSSWEIIKRLSAQDGRVRGFRFSRNFGHHMAITAGLDQSKGDWVVVMDSDLQDPPGLIPALYAKAQEGFDIVRARRINKKYCWAKRATASLFYRAFRYLSGTKFDGQSGVYQMLSRPVVDSLCRLRETARFFPGMVDWVGFKRADIPCEHGHRYGGETKYPLYKQVSLAVNSLLSFSEKPLQFVVYFGLAMAGVSFLYALSIIVRALRGEVVVLGYASLITSVFIVGGLTIMTLGVVGLYVGQIFRQVKGRPLYILSSVTGTCDEDSGTKGDLAVGPVD